jgi:hypothetical protein
MTTININVYPDGRLDAVSLPGAPAAAAAAAPAPGKPVARSIEAAVRNVRNGNIALVTMTNSVGADPIEFRGIMASADYSKFSNLRVSLPQGELAKMQIRQTGPADIAILDQHGHPTDYRVYRYASVRALADRYVLESGVFVDDAGREFEFVVSSDPPILVPVVVIGVVAILGCLVKSLISDAEEICRERLKDATDACVRGGGLPTFNIKSTYGVGYPPFRIGCGADCEFDCKGKPQG